MTLHKALQQLPMDILERRARAAKAKEAVAPVPRARPPPRREKEDRYYDEIDLVDDDSDDLGSRKGCLLAKRNIFRRVAQRGPGRLALKGIEELSAHFGSLYSEEGEE